MVVENGDILCNYFQHQPYLDDFNAEKGTHLVSVAAVHYEPLGIYPGKTATLDALKDGAKIAVPNDTTNESRALLLLESNGLIKLKEGAGLKATKNDIAENPKKFEIVELEAAQLARSLQDVDIAVINGNYAIQAGLNVSKDALAKEEKDSLAATTYANILVVKQGNETDPRVKALSAALQSAEVKKFIEDKYQGAVVPMPGWDSSTRSSSYSLRVRATFSPPAQTVCSRRFISSAPRRSRLSSRAGALRRSTARTRDTISIMMNRNSTSAMENSA